MKKKIIFIIFSLIFVVFGIFIFIFESNKESVLSPSPALPTPTVFQYNTNPIPAIDFNKEKELQTNYGFERQKVLEEKPWIPLLPLQSSNYFIFYDSQKDEIVVKLYFYATSSLDKNQELQYARQDAVIVLEKLGISIDKEKVVFIEKQQ